MYFFVKSTSCMSGSEGVQFVKAVSRAAEALIASSKASASAPSAQLDADLGTSPTMPSGSPTGRAKGKLSPAADPAIVSHSASHSRYSLQCILPASAAPAASLAACSYTSE